MKYIKLVVGDSNALVQRQHFTLVEELINSGITAFRECVLPERTLHPCEHTAFFEDYFVGDGEDQTILVATNSFLFVVALITFVREHTLDSELVIYNITSLDNVAVHTARIPLKDLYAYRCIESYLTLVQQAFGMLHWR